MCSILNTCNISIYDIVTFVPPFVCDILSKVHEHIDKTQHVTQVPHIHEIFCYQHIVKSFKYIIAIRLHFAQKIRTYSKYKIVHKCLWRKEKNTLASSPRTAGYGHFIHITGNALPRKTASEESSRMVNPSLHRLCNYYVESMRGLT